MEALHTTARLMRSHPEHTAPEALLESLRDALRGAGSRLLS